MLTDGIAQSELQRLESLFWFMKRIQRRNDYPDFSDVTLRHEQAAFKRLTQKINELKPS